LASPPGHIAASAVKVTVIGALIARSVNTVRAAIVKTFAALAVAVTVIGALTVRTVPTVALHAATGVITAVRVTAIGATNANSVDLATSRIAAATTTKYFPNHGEIEKGERKRVGGTRRL
jgi:hypothetical protein